MSNLEKSFYISITLVIALMFVILGLNVEQRESVQTVVTAKVIDKEREQSVSYNSFGTLDSGVRFHRPTTTKRYSIGLGYNDDVYFLNTSREVFVQLEEGDTIDVLLHERVDEFGNTVWRDITFN